MILFICLDKPFRPRGNLCGRERQVGTEFGIMIVAHILLNNDNTGVQIINNKVIISSVNENRNLIIAEDSQKGTR